MYNEISTEYNELITEYNNISTKYNDTTTQSTKEEYHKTVLTFHTRDLIPLHRRRSSNIIRIFLSAIRRHLIRVLHRPELI